MLQLRAKHAPRCPHCGEPAPSGRNPIDTIILEAIRDLDSEITVPSTLGASVELVRHVRDRLARALEQNHVHHAPISAI